MPILPDYIRREKENWNVPLDADEKAMQAVIDTVMKDEEEEESGDPWITEADLMQESDDDGSSSSGELERSREEDVVDFLE